MQTIMYQDEKGYRYIPVFQPELSNLFEYTRKKVYHIYTDNPKWCGKILPEVVNDTSIDVGTRTYWLERTNNSIEWGLKPYHKISFKDIEELDEDICEIYNFESIGIDSSGVYEYEIIYPYDD